MEELDVEAVKGLRHLLKAPSKKAVEELLMIAFRYRTARSGELPAKIVSGTAAGLKITEDEARELLGSLVKLVRRALYEGTDAESVLAVFPEGFHPKLAALLTQTIVAFLPQWRSEMSSSLVSLPRLQEIDWRIDVKSASEKGRMKVPTLLVKLQVEKPPTRVGQEKETQNVTFELDRATLETMLDGMGRIRDQLNTISGQ
jgi:hypothetical protein